MERYTINAYGEPVPCEQGRFVLYRDYQQLSDEHKAALNSINNACEWLDQPDTLQRGIRQLKGLTDADDA